VRKAIFVLDPEDAHVALKIHASKARDVTASARGGPAGHGERSLFNARGQ
jgi:hypothetical protein